MSKKDFETIIINYGKAFLIEREEKEREKQKERERK